MRIISLGWGVQSFTLATMVALGELEPIDYAIHADTTHESQLTYEFAARWTGWLEGHGVKVVTVRNSDNCIIDRWNGVRIPAFTISKNGKGVIRRQCTFAWKVAPMRRWMQLNRNKQGVDQWIGISLDEFQRMRDSDVKYIKNVYPLIDKRLTRNDCAKWLQSHGLEIPPKSACTFCPFHNTSDWRRIKDIQNDWVEAVNIDKSIRMVRPLAELFIHPSCKPLDEVDFRTAEEKGQLSLWDNECTGICGV